MIRYVSEGEFGVEFVIHERLGGLKAYRIDDPIIIRYNKFCDYYRYKDHKEWKGLSRLESYISRD